MRNTWRRHEEQVSEGGAEVKTNMIQNGKTKLKASKQSKYYIN